MEKQLELDWKAAAHLEAKALAPPESERIHVTQAPSLEKSELSEFLIQEQSTRLSGNQDDLLVEPTYATPFNSNQTERIQYLEQALDQCQIYINELKLQLANQEFLEAQLAATEEVSHIQQQAITTLKSQLACQTGQLATVQTSASHLEIELSDRQLIIDDLEGRLHRTKATIAGQQEIISALQQTQGPDSGKNKVIQGLSKNLLNAQTKLEALETEFASQLILQAKLQHSSQELEAKCLIDQERITQLEQQVTEMQEQILQQAQEASESETAVQHWKDRCLTAEQTVLQLKAILEQLLTERHLSDLPLPTTGEHPEEDPVAASPNLVESEPNRLLKGLKLDLPAFLHLRRNARP